MIKNYLKFNKLNFIKIFIFFSFLICWQSVSTTFEDLLIKENFTNISLLKMVNFTRHLLVYLVFPILVLLQTSLFFKENKNKFFEKNSLFFFLLFFYFLFQIPGLILTENSIYNISFVISAINIILLLNISNFYLSDKEKIIFIFILLFFLILIFLIIYPQLLAILIKGKITFYGFYSVEDPFFLNKSSPRATGIARTILIITIIVDLLVYKFDFLGKKFLIIFTRVFCLYNIFLFQSRTIIFLASVYLIFILIFDKNHKEAFINKIILYLIFPLFLTYSTFVINNYSINFKEASKEISKDNINEIFNVKKLPTRKVLEDNFSSGRVEDWKELSISIFERPIFGFGSQADRYLINQTASNGLLYAINSSGIVGFIFFLTFSIIVFLKSIKILFINNSDYFSRLISLSIILILARSILESSYAVFGLDFILICTFAIFLDNKMNTYE